MVFLNLTFLLVLAAGSGEWGGAFSCTPLLSCASRLGLDSVVDLKRPCGGKQVKCCLFFVCLPVS